MENLKTNKPERNSGIELLKVVAIFLVVMSHVIQTLHSENTYFGCQDYVLPLDRATKDFRLLVLGILQCAGALGNSIFFVCSAWFLLDSKRVDAKKWWFLLLEIWIVSVVILIVAYAVRGGNINTDILLHSLLPNTLSANWYMTCYLLFYLVHPALNGMISRMNHRTLLKVTSILAILYILQRVALNPLFSSPLAVWIVIYFAMAYMKRYLKHFSSGFRVNLCLLLAGLAGNIGVVCLTNFLGLRIGFFSNKLLIWNASENPFIILMAITLLNLMRRVNWQNSFVNHISRLSMLVYITHENLILRTYYRPYLFKYVYENFGYQHILLWILLMAIIIFLVFVCVSLLYEQTLRKFVKSLSEKLYLFVCRLYQVYEEMILKIH